jgi:hypothetical protein
MFGHGRKTHGEGLGKVRHGDLAGCESGENRSAGWIRKGREGGAEAI